MRKRKKAYGARAVLLVVFLLAAVCAYRLPCLLREARSRLENRFDAAIAQWRSGDFAAAERNTRLNFFELLLVRRPAKYIYWNAKALERLGRRAKAGELKERLLKKYPADYYAFLLVPGTGGVTAKNRGALLHKAQKRFATPYAEAVRSASQTTGVSCALIWAVMKRESKFNPAAQSSSGATGLMQIMPVTAKYLARRHKLQDIDIRAPEDNILLGAYQLKDLLAQFDGHFVFAVAAYNAGASNVNKWRARYEADDIWTEQIPYSETREFVRCVTENYELYKKLLLKGMR